MRLVIQRVRSAAVSVGGREIGRIGTGYMVLLGAGQDDSRATVDMLARKLYNLRIFQDEQGKTNLAARDVGGELLVVSQFTLYADCRRGNRPGFTYAAPPALANELYEYFLEVCRGYFGKVEHGEFGADMLVSIENDGPFTLMWDSREFEKQ